MRNSRDTQRRIIASNSPDATAAPPWVYIPWLCAAATTKYRLPAKPTPTCTALVTHVGEGALAQFAPPSLMLLPLAHLAAVVLHGTTLGLGLVGPLRTPRFGALGNIVNAAGISTAFNAC